MLSRGPPQQASIYPTFRHGVREQRVIPQRAERCTLFLCLIKSSMSRFFEWVVVQNELGNIFNNIDDEM